MTVSINVDELDILSVAEGQTAAVTLDAPLRERRLKGRSLMWRERHLLAAAAQKISGEDYP